MTFPIGDPFGGLLADLGLNFDPEGFNPDSWLGGAVEQPDTPPPPPEGGRVRNEPHTVTAPMGASASGGQIGVAIDNAMKWLGTMYDWGGNGQNGRGVDCSGLIYAAFRAAGFNIERYRAVDYGRMGVAVDPNEARPGDIVYFDNPNSDTDHVGIYLGNGKFLESPQAGDRVKISQLRGGAVIRRIFPESAYGDLTTSDAGNYVYNAPTGERYVAEGRGVRDPFADVMAQLDISTDPDDMISGLEAKGQLDDMLREQDTGLPAPAPVPLHQRGAGGSAPTARGGLTVGQVSGLSPAEAWIIQHESGGDPRADNPTSTAFGIWQGLAATRRDYAGRFGYSPDTVDIGQQLVMFRAYLKDRYGSAENAKRFWEENGWY
jgi:hypothetical protein